jgi:hypothetical protein
MDYINSESVYSINDILNLYKIEPKLANIQWI